MCDVDRRLVAWLDQELPEDEAADVGRHVKICSECRKRADAYKHASILFDAYCHALGAANRRQRRLHPKLVGAAAAAAVLALMLLVPSTHVQITQPQSHVISLEAPVRAGAPLASPREFRSGKHRAIRTADQNVGAAVQNQDANSLPAGPAVQITIPAEAVLPPGAAPAGENFVVDFNIAPDGSAQGIRLSTQLAGFERRATQP
ncbi:MAG TPA: zf-HC2 domain-containing protein [Candidatus Acidoferrales bacterium]|nr:zf-HC2 domain-containing protein [Candidatus Acidoferrales bacterium]